MDCLQKKVHPFYIKWINYNRKYITDFFEILNVKIYVKTENIIYVEYFNINYAILALLLIEIISKCKTDFSINYIIKVLANNPVSSVANILARVKSPLYYDDLDYNIYTKDEVSWEVVYKAVNKFNVKAIKRQFKYVPPFLYREG